MDIIPIEKIDCEGVYILYNGSKKIIYIGQAQNMLERIATHFKIFKRLGRDPIKFISYIPTKSQEERNSLEFKLIDKHKPKYCLRNCVHRMR